jgi:hypothetical protein
VCGSEPADDLDEEVLAEPQDAEAVAVPVEPIMMAPVSALTVRLIVADPVAVGVFVLLDE